MKKNTKTARITTFLGPDASIEGTLAARGVIRIDGTLRGEIKGTHATLIVGEHALIEAEINTDTAIIMGRVKGTVQAREKIEVHPPGHVTGDICAPVISIGSGATFNGNCGMIPPEPLKQSVSHGEEKTSGQKKE
ncbi:MAG: polymer-forming cytoskeletal protein [Desulfobacterales bacterium]